MSSPTLNEMNDKPDKIKIEENKGDQCNFFVVRKKRLCRMTVRPGALFCGEHLSHMNPKDTNDSDNKRVPCPLDPKHTCYLNKLEKHLQVCNAKPTDLPSYLMKNYNQYPHDGKDSKNEIACERRPLSQVPKDELMNIIAAVEKIHSDNIKGSIIDKSSEKPHPTVEPELLNDKRADGSRRHFVQTSSLLNIIESERLLTDKTCFVELGAGRGQVSFFLAETLSKVSGSSVLLVDRASHRHKHDNKLDKEYHNVTRIRADISDLILAELPIIKESEKVVGVSKHLCGIATDLAMTCLTNPNICEKTNGLIMATCCHHRCEWNSYVGKRFLEDQNISQEMFNVICGLVSWGTCGTGLSRERRAEIANAKQAKKPKYDPLHSGLSTDECNLKLGLSSHDPSDIEKNVVKNIQCENKDITSLNKTESELEKVNIKSDFSNNNFKKSNCDLSYEQKCVVGMKAKSVLDWGRIEYLKSKKFNVKLCYYVSNNISPENVCIVASKVADA